MTGTEELNQAGGSMTTAAKTVLVTGANRGIGQALVEEGLRRGKDMLDLNRCVADKERSEGEP
jgi:NAD(P)-dependent dehydrogenase (short-subunit alcohol dehydrogenase family)